MLDSGLIKISVIIPAYNAADTLPSCLSALQKQTLEPTEILLVDDASTDSSVQIARRMGIRVFENRYNNGPAVCRNYGAKMAKGDILLFVDADVVVPEWLCSAIAQELSFDPTIEVVQTLYTPKCPIENNTTQYQNLYYHYALARMDDANPAVLATWCTAVRRSVFIELGGFDSRIPEPTVEDEELGYAIADRGGRIVLRKDLQVTHLASYTTGQFVRRRLRMARAQAKSGWRSFSNRLLKRYVNIRETGTHHSRWVVLSILLTLAAALVLPACLLSLLLGGPWPQLMICWLLLLLAALICHLSFFAMARRLMGARVFPAFAGLCLLDMLVLGVGVAHGTVQFFSGQRF